jgi:hypothetical protein
MAHHRRVQADALQKGMSTVEAFILGWVTASIGFALGYLWRLHEEKRYGRYYRR